jgi:hypothetical protein
MLHIDPDSRLAKLLMIGVVLPGAAIVVWLLLANFFRSIRSANWPTAPGIILESRIKKPDPNPHNLGGLLERSRVTIRYQYALGGRQFENDTIFFGLASEYGAVGNADKKSAKFPKGQIVDVHVDPDHPEVSCLETGITDWEDFIVLLIALFAICLGMKMLGDFLRGFFARRNLALVNKSSLSLL